MVVDRQPARRQIAIAAAAGLLLRLAFGLLYWVDKPMTHDEHEYLALAAALAQGKGFVYTEPATGTTAQFGRAPGYPAFLSLIGAGTTTATAAPVRVKVVQAFIGAITIWLIAMAAWGAAGPIAGIVAAWLAAIHPPLVWISSYVFSESLYAALAIGAALALQKTVELAGPRPREGMPVAGALVSGLLTGVAILVRPAMIFFLPLALIWLLRRRLAWAAVGFVAGAVLVVAPWTVRNYRSHGRFVLVASEGGVTFWTGNHPLASGEGDLAANPELKRAEIAFRSGHPNLTSEELEPLYYQDAFRHIKSDPVWWTGLLARKAFYTIVPTGRSYALHSMRYRAASVVSYLLLLPMAGAGVLELWRRPRRPTAMLLLGASAGIVCMVFFPQERFRIPVIDPLLIVCAAAFLSTQAARRGR
jgi:hypothetical protein